MSFGGSIQKDFLFVKYFFSRESGNYLLTPRAIVCILPSHESKYAKTRDREKSAWVV
jgi:hypothetical protein